MIPRPRRSLRRQHRLELGYALDDGSAFEPWIGPQYRIDDWWQTWDATPKKGSCQLHRTPTLYPVKVRLRRLAPILPSCDLSCGARSLIDDAHRSLLVSALRGSGAMKAFHFITKVHPLSRQVFVEFLTAHRAGINVRAEHVSDRLRELVLDLALRPRTHD